MKTLVIIIGTLLVVFGSSCANSRHLTVSYKYNTTIIDSTNLVEDIETGMMLKVYDTLTATVTVTCSAHGNKYACKINPK